MLSAVAQSCDIVPFNEGRRISSGSTELIMTRQDRRRDKKRTIWNVSGLLSHHQIRALNRIESNGWQVFCVRTSLSQDPVIVVVNSVGDAFATLEYDGELNLTPDLSVRKDDLSVYTVNKTTPSRISAYLQRRRMGVG